MEIDHLGIAVESLQEALGFYRDVLGLEDAGIEHIAAEQVTVAMLPLSARPQSPRVELLQPSENGSTVARFLEKRGPGLHHVALRVDNLQATVDRMKTAGARILNEPRQ